METETHNPRKSSGDTTPEAETRVLDACPTQDCRALIADYFGRFGSSVFHPLDPDSWARIAAEVFPSKALDERVSIAMAASKVWNEREEGRPRPMPMPTEIVISSDRTKRLLESAARYRAAIEAVNLARGKRPAADPIRVEAEKEYLNAHYWYKNNREETIAEIDCLFFGTRFHEHREPKP